MRKQRSDILLCPPHALPATPHIKAFDLLAAASYSLLINLLGLPSGTVSVTRVARARRAAGPIHAITSAKCQADRPWQRGFAGRSASIELAVERRYCAGSHAGVETCLRSKSDYPGSCVVPTGKIGLSGY